MANLANVQTPNSVAKLRGDAMLWLDELLAFFSYYTYSWSLTTDPCSEVVTWIVMKKRLSVGKNQVDIENMLENSLKKFNRSNDWESWLV
jgi:carbonic anhydrase